MKTIYYSLFSLLFLFSCSSPQKLLEEGKYLKAHKVSLEKLKQRKIKQEYIYTLEAAYTLLTERHQKIFENGKAQQKPAMWPRLFEHCLMMYDLQKDTREAEVRLRSNGYQPQLKHLPVEDWLEEARLNSAIYYYSLAQEHIPAARRGNQLAARQAFDLLKNVQNYLRSFRDTPQLTDEMYALGTTHIQLNLQINPYEEQLESTFFDLLFARTQFPLRKDWQVYYLNASQEQKIDYDLDLYFSDLYVSNEDCRSSSCSNSEEVCVGYREVEVWSEQDSAYVVEKEPIYETISVTVTTFFQSKSSHLLLNYVYRDRAREQEVFFQQRGGACDWSNCYSTYFGDPDAMNLFCSTVIGSYSDYPSDWDLLVDAARSVRRPFYKSLKLDIEDHLFHSRPPQ